VAFGAVVDDAVNAKAPFAQVGMRG